MSVHLTLFVCQQFIRQTIKSRVSEDHTLKLEILLGVEEIANKVSKASHAKLSRHRGKRDATLLGQDERLMPVPARRSLF